MLRHNLKIFFRNIKNNKGTFLINTFGLGIGIASFLLLALYVHSDLTYNHFHDNFENIYRVRDDNSFQTKGPLLPKLFEDIPEIENGTRIFDWERFRMSHGEVAFQENIFYVDEGFFSVFTFPFLEGSAKNTVKDKYGVVISSDFAKKYFGDEPALGKRLQIKFEDLFLEVKGVVAIPANSSVQFDIVASYETGEEISPWIKDIHDWYNLFSITYVQLKDGIGPEVIDGKLQQIVKENYLPIGQNETVINLLPFGEYHAAEESNQTLIVILSIIAFGIISIAIVNFINLTITSVLSRIKEIGIKKVHGASRSDLFGQIMTESFAVSFIALFLGLGLMALFLPTFNSLFDTDLNFTPFQNPVFLWIPLMIWAVVGILSGLIPSMFWAKGKLTESLKGIAFSGKRSSGARHSLIVIQFSIAIVLISGTFLVRKQVNAMMEKDPLFDTENVIITELQPWQFPDMEKTSNEYKRIAAEIEASPLVETVSFSQCIPGYYSENYNVFYPQGDNLLESIHLRKAYVGENYFKTFGIQFLSGGGFEKGSVNYENAIILNKTATQELGYKAASGQVLNETSTTGDIRKLVGIVDDFSYQGVQHKSQPLAHIFSEQEDFTNWGYFSIKARKGASLQVLDLLKQKWGLAFSGIEPKFYFANDKLTEQYKEYIKINTLVAWFSILAILLSCMGLFTLAAYAMAKRTKEIGIRKVNGATISEILILLNKDFLKWVLLSFFIAVPIAWYGMYRWLEGFAYKTTISWWVFGLAGTVAIGIAILTVSWQSFSAAIANPVEALKEE
ncbi:ABC transporter permease [Cyclobacterium qasimii]|uniref:ABC transporter permease n=2 Tax=Cyclobacterium qasimii TaxID=1350429 RepID=A0A512C722_9BACT|nr:ABC transporter permease [Cyclobacterium qasimii]EPR68081.1 putative FtsX-related transmembrane transport protein [Cyclobacterium qasimii M12-11B]GEO20014.1 ABC transporter permease [Cyclobacterium qasimii]